MKQEINKFIEEHPLFNELDNECRDILQAEVQIIDLKKDEFLYMEGELSKGIYVLIRGTAVITVNRNSRDVINRIIFENEVFGIDDTLDHDIRTKGSKSVGGSSRVMFIPVDTVTTIIGINGKFSQKLFKILIKNLKNIERRLESFVFKDAKDRIIDFIKVNATNSGIKVGYETLVKHSFTQQNIADYTGTSRQTVTTILKDLRKNNKITFQRKRILVRNLAKL